MHRDRRIVITGLGTLAPNGNTTKAYWEALCNGQTGVDFITKFDASDFRVKFAAEIKGFDAEKYGIDRRNQRIGAMTSVVAPKLTDKYRSQDHVPMLDAHFEMAAAALKGDLTDSATIAVGSGYEHFQIVMNSLDGVNEPRHNLGHRNMKGRDSFDPHAGHREAALVRNYVFKLIARTLSEVDNLTVVYTSDAAEKHHSNCDEWPHVIVGNHPNLQLDGRFIYYPENGQKGQRTLNAFHNTLLRAGGVELESFGQLVNNVSMAAQVGILPELFA